MDNPILYILLIFIGFNIYRIYKDHKTAKEIKNIPDYHPKLLGVYVKLKGIVVTENKELTPLSNVNCAFYNFKVKGMREVKRTKPNSGYETVSEVLNKEDSEEFELLHHGAKIKIKFMNKDRSTKVQFNIHHKTNSSKKANPKYPSKAKFTSYEYHENYIKEDEELTIYGRLIEEAGETIITNTYSDRLPFMLFLGDDRVYETYTKKIFWSKILIGMGSMGVVYILASEYIFR